MKKLSSLLLAALLLITFGLTSFAAQGVNSNNGKITVDNAINGQTYDIYQILTLESFNTETNAYAYKVTDAWDEFANGSDIKNIYLKIDDQGYVSWVQNANASEFAEKAIAYAKANNIQKPGTQVASNGTVVFENLNLGYYLVATSLGSLCSLDTTDPEVIIREKNGQPTVDKKVQEDISSSWGSQNDSDIGQVVNFKATINVIDGLPKDYVLHDKMSEGLTFDVNSITVSNGIAPLIKDVDYFVSTNCTDGCTFEISFNDDSLNPNDVITVTYSAKLNENAVIGVGGNTNDFYLKYGDNQTTTSTTKTYTWDMDILKYANGDTSKVLAGAKFVLLNSSKTKVATVVSGKITGWVDIPSAGSDGSVTWPSNTELITDSNGKIEIDGIDSDTYYLRETKAPDGYNKLAKDIQVEVSGATSGGGNTLTYTTVEAKVNNQSGTELPSTGSTGTMIFIVSGSLLATVAVVFMVTRKKMSVYED